MNEHKIYLIGRGDDDFGLLKVEKNDNLCHLCFNFEEIEIKANAENYFDAFCKLREELESSGLTPLCYGASLDVYPSGFCRYMDSGLKAYKIRKGEPAGRENLVGIFDQGADVIPSSVSNQKEFFQEWLASLNV